jgi:hypothetical protein
VTVQQEFLGYGEALSGLGGGYDSSAPTFALCATDLTVHHSLKQG